MWFLVFVVVAVLAFIGVPGMAQRLDIPGSDDAIIPRTCPTDRVIVRIFGTRSSGDFDPGGEIFGGPIVDMNTANPPPEVFGDGYQNKQLDHLIRLTPSATGCVVTLSYDNVYLDYQNRKYAYNDTRSPWAQQPEDAAKALQTLLERVGGGNSKTFDIVAFSAGGIVPTYWAARPDPNGGYRTRIHSVIVVDGVVSGNFLDWPTCIGLDPHIRHFPFWQLGPIPCQFAHNSPSVKKIHDIPWWLNYGNSPNGVAGGVPFADIRAKGDPIVSYDVAAPPGATINASLPPLAVPCATVDFTNLWCVNLLARHGWVLFTPPAIQQTAIVIDGPWP